MWNMSAISSSNSWGFVAAVTGTVLTAIVASAVVLSKPKKQEKTVETWESKIPTKCGTLRELWPDTLFILETSGAEMGPPIRNMIIYKVPDGSQRLVIFNGIAVGEETVAQIEKLGRPTVLVIPNLFHRDCAAVYKGRYPHLMVVCPRAARENALKVVSAIGATTQEWVQQDEWSEFVHAREIEGWAEFETILEFQLDGSKTNGGKKAMVSADLFFTIPRKEKTGFIEQLFIWLFDTSINVPPAQVMPTPRLSRIARWTQIPNFEKAEQWYRDYAAQHGPHIAVICVGHGIPIIELDEKEGCRAALEGVADQLVKTRKKT